MLETMLNWRYGGLSTLLDRAKMEDQASYICDSCGEEIVVPIDLPAGAQQE